MNKRIKKKKARQALQREKELLEQELPKLSPSELEELSEVASQIVREFSQAIIQFSETLAGTIVSISKILEGIIEETERQRTQNARRGTVQVPRYPANHRFTKARVDNKKSRQPMRSFNRNQQTHRNHRGQARR
ncbi:hypothetical protein [Streptococcus suis]|uniref:Uncharacterized protein n=1 Tax=Streptococcus suis TaxID=1307 RepID=A0A822W0A8_STRSU|nr:hypothetical protein [Streptococcus suis]CZA70770.1 Uncharacterised protein [Streptococcus suis]